MFISKKDLDDLENKLRKEFDTKLEELKSRQVKKKNVN